MNNVVYHCFFEQSGTFKNEFKKLNCKAYDYDILNDFNETDYQVDLFKSIELAYENQVNRSMISKEYARKFIRENIL